MRRSGRAYILTATGTIPRLLHFFTYISVAASIDYGVPVEIKLWDAGRTPVAHMVDVTNGFGLKVLAEHNFLNDNNIAFSPYGLMGILVALYEGVDGESSYQVLRAMQLPWNRNVMRIGFRDIHRNLKTYFVPEEGFLAGLALNNENVTFNDSYKKILRFYGFDLENDQLPTMSPQGNTTTNETNTVASTMNADAAGDTTTLTTTSSSMAGEEASTTPASTIQPREETTPNSNVATIASLLTTTSGPSSAPNAESTPVPSSDNGTEQMTSIRTTSETQVTTITATNDIIATTSQTESASASTTALPATITVLTTTNIPATPTVDSTTVSPNTMADTETLSTQTSQATAALTSDPAFDAETISQQTSQATVALTNEPTSNNEVEIPSTAEIVSSTPISETSLITSTLTSDSTSDSTTSPTTLLSTSDVTNTQQTEVTSTGTNTTPIDSTTAMVNESTLETLQRRKKSIVDFIFTNPPYFEDYVYYRSYDVPPVIPSPNFDDKMFLANGLRNVQVTYMQYDTVLEHAYLPHLEASALRLPLDSDRYYLLVVLPRRGGSQELGRLLARMARESDLSDVYNALRPRRVRGIVPSFTVKGHVTLTTDLQKLGIRDVFEPRQRDFTPMTRQTGVYVRSIEQAVSVAIRKYRPDDHKKNRYVSNRDPVKFYATYPFLYFVMDSNIHVSLMAGKMVDPLNSRIL